MVLDWVIVIFLVLFGLGLILAEIIFVPGTTFVGILGIFLTVAGVYMGFTTFGNTTGYWLLGLSAVAGLAAVVYALRNDTWSRFSLQSSNKSRFNDDFPQQLTVGMTGKTMSELRPQGKAVFGDTISEVRTHGQYLPGNTEVRITKIEFNTIYVEPISLYK